MNFSVIVIRSTALLAVVLAPAVLAADGAAAVAPLAEKTTSGSYILQLVMSLGVVLLGIGALAWILKRVNRLPNNSAAKMRVLAALSLGARERAVLVQVGDTQMLLGVSQGRVATLHVFDEPVIDSSNSDNGPAMGANFAAILSGLGKRGGGSSR